MRYELHGHPFRCEGLARLPKNPYVEIKRWASTLPVDEDASKTKQRARGYRFLMRRTAAGASPYTQEVIQPSLRLMREIGLLDAAPPIETLPRGAFRVTIQFELLTPWMWHGADWLWPCERSVLRDEVFKTPEMPASAWKGILREVLDARETPPAQIARMLGAQQGGPAQAGRLWIEPTFFDDIALCVQLPIDRREGKGSERPIYEEQCPAGSAGVFCATYAPFPSSDGPGDALAESLDDLALLIESLTTVLHERGFSAGASKGYGLAKDRYERIDEHRRRQPGGQLEVCGVDFRGARPRDIRSRGVSANASRASFASAQECVRLIEYAKRYGQRRR